MSSVPAIELLGWLALAVVVLRAIWLLTHQAAHHAALRPVHWAQQVDRAMLARASRPRA